MEGPTPSVTSKPGCCVSAGHRKGAPATLRRRCPSLEVDISFLPPETVPDAETGEDPTLGDVPDPVGNLPVPHCASCRGQASAGVAHAGQRLGHLERLQKTTVPATKVSMTRA